MLIKNVYDLDKCTISEPKDGKENCSHLTRRSLCILQRKSKVFSRITCQLSSCGSSILTLSLTIPVATITNI